MRNLLEKVQFEHVLILAIVLVLTWVMALNVEMTESAKIVSFLIDFSFFVTLQSCQ